MSARFCYGLHYRRIYYIVNSLQNRYRVIRMKFFVASVITVSKEDLYESHLISKVSILF